MKRLLTALTTAGRLALALALACTTALLLMGPAATMALAQISPTLVHPSGGGVATSVSAAAFPLRGPDGSAAAPSYSFADDSDTGMYSSADAEVSFTRNGSPIFTIGSNLLQTKLAANYGFGWTSSSLSTDGADLVLFRDAANTLAQRNGTNAQTLNIYNTFTDASNYARLAVTSTSTGFNLLTQAAGTGISAAGNAFTSIQGSKTKALTDAAATQFVRVSIPQTMGSNYAGGQVIYTVYARDATTGTQTLSGIAEFACINNAGTESCSAIVETYKTAAVVTGGTLTCAITAVTGLTDEIALAANCDTSLVSTALNIQYRLDMPQPNTVTPQ